MFVVSNDYTVGDFSLFLNLLVKHFIKYTFLFKKKQSNSPI